jgi:RNA polymerase sigma factor (sigma-70 family)
MSLVLLRTQSDERLVALAREGHERAFEAIVKRYRRPLLSVCRRMVPEARAEDVLQQAFLSAWSALRRGDQVTDLRAWLFRIVRNAALSNLRGAGAPELLDTLVAAPSPQEESERREVVQETLEAVARLPERQRQALLRIAVQGHSQDEVAAELGLSRTAVRQLVHRARVTLRSAASAVVPLPVVAWLASIGTGAEPMSLRIGGLIAGAGGAGAGATLLKAGAVAGVAAAVSAPILAEHRPPRAFPTPTATAAPTATPTARAARTSTPAATATAAARAPGGADARVSSRGRAPRPVVASLARRHASRRHAGSRRHHEEGDDGTRGERRRSWRAHDDDEKRPGGRDDGSRAKSRGHGYRSGGDGSPATGNGWRRGGDGSPAAGNGWRRGGGQRHLAGRGARAGRGRRDDHRHGHDGGSRGSRLQRGGRHGWSGD